MPRCRQLEPVSYEERPHSGLGHRTPAEFERKGRVEARSRTTQDALAQTEGDVAIQLIALYKALGGGWEAAGPLS